MTTRIIFTAFLCLAGISACAQGMEDVEMKVTNVRDNVYMIEGRGGNIGAISGEDGVIIIDDQFAELTDKIKAAVAEFSDESIRYIINTHWHGDHAGGNENLAKDGSTIVAHENVRMRLSTEQYNAFWDRTTPPTAEAAWPVITFSENMRLHLNGEDITIVHRFKGHTDGDALIKFEKANVIHAGDSFVTYGYPYIDGSAGGTFKGLINNAGAISELCDDDTIIIPGHGPLSKKEDVMWFMERLESIHKVIATGIAAGKTADDLVNENALQEFADWDGGFIKSKDFINIVYDEIASSK